MAGTCFPSASDASCISMLVVAFSMGIACSPMAEETSWVSLSKASWVGFGLGAIIMPRETSWVGFGMGAFGMTRTHFLFKGSVSCISMQVVAFSMGIAHSPMAGEASWVGLSKSSWVGFGLGMIIMPGKTSWVSFGMEAIGMAGTHFPSVGAASCISMWAVAFGMGIACSPTAGETNWVSLGKAS